MIIKKKQMKKDIRSQMRGGNGDIEITHLVNKEDLKHSRLLGYITIPVNGSIGDHEHLDETEYYIVLKGIGIVVDDNIEKEVESGDVVVTGGGATHSIRNTGNIPLEMIAIIILE